MMPSMDVYSASGVIPGLGLRVSLGGPEPRQPGTAYGNVLRCWNCGTQIGERQGRTFYVNSNKVEIGNIPITAEVWRRCRGGKANPACRALNTMPHEWVAEATQATTPVILPILPPVQH